MKNKICIVELYSEYFKYDEQLIQYLRKKGNEVFSFSFFDKPKKKLPGKKDLLLQEIVCSLKLLYKFFFFRNKRIFCQGGHFSFFFYNRLLSWMMGKDYHIYVYNFYLHALGEKKIVKQLLRFFLNSRHITLIVQSPGEIKYYKKISAKCEILFIPYSADIDETIEVADIKLKDYVFTGGYTNRDYRLIIECARIVSDTEFLIVASSLNKKDFEGDLPANITLYEDIQPDLFYSLMKGAKYVIVPLEKNVGASGQMLCLGAMGLSKPVIYTDVSAINYYFERCSCGIPYATGDINSLVDAVKEINSFSKAEKDEMGRKAYDTYKNNFTRQKRDIAIVDILTG